jgi:hypothetical protein
MPFKSCLRANANDEFIRIIHELAILQPVLKQSMEELESSMMVFACQSLHSIDSDKSADEAILSLDEPEPPLLSRELHMDQSWVQILLIGGGCCFTS